MSKCASDSNELVAVVNAIPTALDTAGRVLVNSVYANGSEVGQLEARGVEVLVAVGAQGVQRRHDFRPQPLHKSAKEPRADWLQAMGKKTEPAQNQTHYRLCQHSVEPVSDIVKHATGFRQF